ncbi:unnamed protein product [Leuciscus chuanchicus]
MAHANYVALLQDLSDSYRSRHEGDRVLSVASHNEKSFQRVARGPLCEDLTDPITVITMIKGRVLKRREQQSSQSLAKCVCVYHLRGVSKVGTRDTLDEVGSQIPPGRLTLSCTTGKALRGGMHPPAACLVSTATSVQTVKSTHHQAMFASVNIQRCRPIQDYVTLLVVHEKLIQIKFVKKLKWLIVSVWVRAPRHLGDIADRDY